jgi:hypothetical protein
MQSNEAGRPVVSGMLLASGAGIAMVALLVVAQAQDANPLLMMKGSWNGSGNITLSDGNKERLRCRSNYNPDGSGASMQLSLTCASDSYKFELASQVQYRNGQVTGNWNETTRSQAGQLTGTASGGKIDARVEGQTFAAFLVINTRGDQQNISIRAPGSAMQEVAISLNRQR